MHTCYAITLWVKQRGQDAVKVANMFPFPPPPDVTHKYLTRRQSQQAYQNVTACRVKQRGEEAVRADNVLHSLCYEGAVDVTSIANIRTWLAKEVPSHTHMLYAVQRREEAIKADDVLHSLYDEPNSIDQRAGQNVIACRVKQQGEEAVRADKVFHLPCYEGAMDTTSNANSRS